MLLFLMEKTKRLLSEINDTYNYTEEMQYDEVGIYVYIYVHVTTK